MFIAPKLIFDGIEGVGSHFHVSRIETLFFSGTGGLGSLFHVLRSRTRFGQYRVHRVLFSCFKLPDPFWAEQRTPSIIFKFHGTRHVFRCTEGVGTCFHVSRYRTRFGRYRVPFSCFALPDSFSSVPRTSGPVFMVRASRLIFSGTGGVGSSLQVLRSQTRFGLYRGRQVPF
jgi:hypothetical protein